MFERQPLEHDSSADLELSGAGLTSFWTAALQRLLDSRHPPLSDSAVAVVTEEVIDGLRYWQGRFAAQLGTANLVNQPVADAAGVGDLLQVESYGYSTAEAQFQIALRLYTDVGLSYAPADILAEELACEHVAQNSQSELLRSFAAELLKRTELQDLNGQSFVKTMLPTSLLTNLELVKDDSGELFLFQMGGASDSSYSFVLDAGEATIRQGDTLINRPANRDDLAYLQHHCRNLNRRMDELWVLLAG